MRRRELITLIGAAAAGCPLSAFAQQKHVPVIGYLSGGSAAFYEPILPAFRDGLRESGYIEGQNVAIEYLWGEGQYDRLAAFAAEFVSRRVDLIAATGGVPASRVAKKATSTIPIIFTSGSDPVADGLVSSLARPGGNLTGVSFLTAELYPKRLEALSELVPEARLIAFLVNPNNSSTEESIGDAAAAAEAKRVKLEIFKVTTEADFKGAFASLEKLRAGAVMIQTDPFIDQHNGHVIALAADNRIPAMYGFRRFALAGGLMSYGVSIAGVYRQLGVYAGKILSGIRPADLPVVQPTTFGLVINLNTAKALGLTVPQTLLARADEVIE